MRPIALGGIDVFHLVRDRTMRARGLPGNHCLFVVEIEGRIDEGRLRRRVALAMERLPELGARLRNGFPPRWVFDGHAPPVTVHSGDGRVEELLSIRTNGAEPWALDVVRGEHHDRIVLRSFHPLVDGRGAERLVRWLGSGSGERDEPEAPPAPDERFESAERPIRALDRTAKLTLMKVYNQHVLELARAPIMSASTNLPRGRVLGPTRMIRVALDEAQTSAFDLRVRKVAKLAETSLMLIASLRALDEVLKTRGFAPPYYLVPVPLSLDPKVSVRRLLGNNLTMMMFALTRAELADEAIAVARIAEQQRAIVKQKLDLAMLAALDLARWLPAPVFRFIESVPTAGELASLIVSNPGAVTLTTFAGHRVLDAYPLPSVVLPPGAQVIFTRYCGKLSALLVYVDGALLQAEAELCARTLRAELCPL